MENLNEFVNCVVGIAKENYDVTNVLEKMRDYDNFVYYIQYYKKEVEAKKDDLDKLNQEINYSKGILDSYIIILDKLSELEIMSFGINELWILFNTLNEIGRENNKSLDETKKEFFDDLKSYDEIIRSRKERDRLQSEVKNLEIQTIKEREKYNSYPQIIQSIDRLSNAGIYEDILEIEKIISMTRIQIYKDKPMYKQNLRMIYENKEI